MKTAVVFGATGLVGSYLLDELKIHPEYTSIKVFTRRPIAAKHSKVEEFMVDFDNLEKSAQDIKGDDLFICLGTTLKKAGSVSEVEKIDWHLPIKIARQAQLNGIKNIAIISSIGAKHASGNYYLRTKGSMEKEMMELGIVNLKILRPSLLLGDRKESRFGEDAGKIVFKLFGFLLFGKIKKYRAIHGKTVARAMIKSFSLADNKVIYESDFIQTLGSAT